MSLPKKELWADQRATKTCPKIKSTKLNSSNSSDSLKESTPKMESLMKKLKELWKDFWWVFKEQKLEIQFNWQFIELRLKKITIDSEISLESLLESSKPNLKRLNMNIQTSGSILTPKFSKSSGTNKFKSTRQLEISSTWKDSAKELLRSQSKMPGLSTWFTC